MMPIARLTRLGEHLAPLQRAASPVEDASHAVPRPRRPSPAPGLVSPTTSEPTRVVIADDHAVVRAGLRAVLGTAKDIQVVGEARDGGEAVALAERLRPDVVVMDLGMAPMNGAEATAEIVARGLPCRVLILTMQAAESHLMPLLEGGAWGYLSKSAADRALVAAVRAVARGDLYLLPDAARVLAVELRHERPPGRVAQRANVVQ